MLSTIKIINTKFWENANIRFSDGYKNYTDDDFLFEFTPNERVGYYLDWGWWYDGVWRDGFFVCGSFKGKPFSIWLNGTWISGEIVVRPWGQITLKISPKSCFKPSRTLSLNYAKYN